MEIKKEFRKIFFLFLKQKNSVSKLSKCHSYSGSNFKYLKKNLGIFQVKTYRENS
jgi:hypothetical protein